MWNAFVLIEVLGQKHFVVYKFSLKLKRVSNYKSYTLVLKVYQDSRPHGSMGPYTLLHRRNTSGVKIKPVLKKFMKFIS